MTLTLTPDPDAEVDHIDATYLYDGDGKMVQSVVVTHYEDNTSSSVRTIYVGGIYEFETVLPRFGIGLDSERKYYAGVAMRENDTLYFTLRDHLGSTSVIADVSGHFVSEVR